MRDTIRRIRCSLGRFKFISAIVAIFMSGAMLAYASSAWYYSSLLHSRVESYDRQITRLTREIDDERLINRGKLDRISDRVGVIAQDLSEIADTAKIAADTAKSAATTARGAAKNAAQANIRITGSVEGKNK